MPLVRAAFADGELSYSKVRALTRAAGSEDEAQLLELARRSTASQLERAVRGLRSSPSSDVAVANRGHDRRSVDWWWELDGSLRVTGRLGSEAGAVLVDAIETGAEALHGGPDQRPPLGARRADALTEIVYSGCPRAEVVLHVDAPALACTAERGDELAGDVCAIEDGPAVPSETARRMSCDAELVIANRGGKDGAIDYGRRRRVVSPPLRAALERRDRHCRFPGCVRRHGTHAHHIRHWAHGGRTDGDNLVLLCRFHHRLVHEGGFTVRRRDGGITFMRPDGRAVEDWKPPPLMVAA
jgi:hypothetical protein